MFGAAALALLALSFTTWFRYDVYGSSADGSFVLPHSVDAWQGSSLWTAAVLLMLLACALGIVAALTPARGLGVAVSAVGLAGAFAAGALLARQAWLLKHPPPVGRLRIVFKPASAPVSIPKDPYSIQRDHLASYVTYNGFGQHARPTAIPPIALALTMVVFLALLTLCLNRLQGPPGRGESGDEGPAAT